MPDLAVADDTDLLAFVFTYPQRLAGSMKRLLHFSMIAAGPRALLDMMIDGRELPNGIANRLVSGIDDVDSAALAQHQWTLGRIVAEDDSLMALFDQGLDGIEHRIEGTALQAPLEQFLADFGHRGNDEYELATPAWMMDPRPVFAAIERLVTLHPIVTRRPRPPGSSSTVNWPRRRCRTVCDGPVGHSPSGQQRCHVPVRSAAERAKDILVLENLGARLALHELARRAERRGGPCDHRLAFRRHRRGTPAFRGRSGGVRRGDRGANFARAVPQ